MLTRRQLLQTSTLLINAQSLVIPKTVKAVKAVSPLPNVRVLNITGESRRVLEGTPPPINISSESFFTNDGCKGAIELHGTYFGLPDYMGPYIDDGGELATFKKLQQPLCAVENGFQLRDINQGIIGDCWFLSAIDFTTNSPIYSGRMSTIFKVIDEDACAATVTLYDPKTDSWQSTTIGPELLLEGSRFPTVISTLSKTPHEMWCGMIEKALAKMCSTEFNGDTQLKGYEAIGGGWMSEGMTYLHGKGNCYILPRSEILPLMLRSKEGVQYCANMMSDMLSEGYGLFVSWSKEVVRPLRVAAGLVDSHAYSILEVTITPAGDCIVLMKNPWGRGRWTQDAAIVPVGKDTGIFYMDLVDVVSRCAGFDIYEPLGAHVLQDYGISSTFKKNDNNEYMGSF